MLLIIEKHHCSSILVYLSTPIDLYSIAASFCNDPDRYNNFETFSDVHDYLAHDLSKLYIKDVTNIDIDKFLVENELYTPIRFNSLIPQCLLDLPDLDISEVYSLLDIIH